MKKLFLISACAMGLLWGCSSTNGVGELSSHQLKQQVTKRVFQCDNGVMVEATYLNHNQISLRVANWQGVLDSAVSASGSRYVSNTGWFGKKTEWHEKANQAIFSYENVAGMQEVSCEAKI